MNFFQKLLSQYVAGRNDAVLSAGISSGPAHQFLFLFLLSFSSGAKASPLEWGNSHAKIAVGGGGVLVLVSSVFFFVSIYNNNNKERLMILDLIILLLVGIGASMLYGAKAAAAVFIIGLFFVYTPLAK